MTKAVGQFEVSDWVEAPYFELEAPAKATRAEIKMVFTGDFQGSGDLVYLMSYVNDGLAHYCGVLYFRSTAEDRAGGFTIIDTGVFNENGANSVWTIAQGSGFGAFTGISGSGKAHAGTGRMMAFELDYKIR